VRLSNGNLNLNHQYGGYWIGTVDFAVIAFGRDECGAVIYVDPEE
jgi:hypothetical protein